MSDEPYFLENYDPGKSYYEQKKFDCGNEIINKFVSGSLKKQVREKLSTCFVLVDDSQDGKFVGFYTMTSYAIDASLLTSFSNKLPKKVPCSRMVMLGVDLSCQKQKLGKRLLAHALQKTILASEHIGIYGLYLDADPPAVDFYLSHGFSALKERQDPESTPMFLHVDTVKDGLT